MRIIPTPNRNNVSITLADLNSRIVQGECLYNSSLYFTVYTPASMKITPRRVKPISVKEYVIALTIRNDI